MGDTQHWRLDSKCRKLSPQQADKLFFPDKGGKSKQAKIFCKGCPVLSRCLAEALRGSPEGFQAGTTKDERKELKEFLSVAEIPDVERYLPEGYDKPKTSKVKTTVNPRYMNKLDDPLFFVSGPTPADELNILRESLIT